MSASLSYKLDANGDEVYDVSKYGLQLYLFTKNPERIFAKRKGQPYYAKLANQDEYYPQISKAEDHPIKTRDRYYAKKANGDQFYPKDGEGNDKVFIHSENGRKTVIYARKHDRRQFYPKNKFGDDVRHLDIDIFQDDGTVTYPMDRHGMPIFREDKDTGQKYLQNADGSYRVPTSANGDVVYAQERRYPGGPLYEYYPPDGTIGTASDGNQVYAKHPNGDVIFPRHLVTNDEYYVKNKDRSDRLTHRDNTPIYRYATDHSSTEIYPRVYKNAKYREVIFQNRYALTSTGESLYPLDEYGNEYIIMDADWKKALPSGYPITHDGYVIVPQFQNKPFIIDTLQPAIADSNIIGLLKREDSTLDYITNVKSTRLSRCTKKRKYPIIPLPSLQSKVSLPPFMVVSGQSWISGKTLTCAMVVLGAILMALMITQW